MKNVLRHYEDKEGVEDWKGSRKLEFTRWRPSEGTTEVWKNRRDGEKKAVGWLELFWSVTSLYLLHAFLAFIPGKRSKVGRML